MTFAVRKLPALLALLVSLAGAGWSGSAAATQLPNPPRYYVLDEPSVLSARTLSALQELLVRHDQVTGEQVVIAIFQNLGDEDVVDWTHRVFGHWGVGRRGKNNGVLLALYWKERKARIEVGYGLEPNLTDSRSKEILSDYLIPELKRGNPDKALTLAALEILRSLDSPLLVNGTAERILRSAPTVGSGREAPKTGSFWWIWLVVGLILASIALNILTAADAHFTGDGWYRPRPRIRPRFRRGSWGAGWGSPVGWGGGAGGGGFRGGGGDSGGGGATGGW